MQALLAALWWFYQLPFLVVLAIDLVLGVFFTKSLLYFYPMLAYGVRGPGRFQTIRYLLYLLVSFVFFAVLGGHPALRNIFPVLLANLFGVLYWCIFDRHREPYRGMRREVVERRLGEAFGEGKSRRQA